MFLLLQANMENIDLEDETAGQCVTTGLKIKYISKEKFDTPSEE